MRTLPLYEQPITSCLTHISPTPKDASCTRCELGPASRVTCLNEGLERAKNARQTVLLVGERPSRMDGATRRPFSVPSYKNVIDEIRRISPDTQIVTDYAVRCETKEIKDKHVAACRVYTADTVENHEPDRILCFGPSAVESVLGRRVSAFQARRGYGWHVGSSGRMIPVFYMYDPGLAARNRFFGAAFLDDLKRALTFVPYPRYTGTVALVDDEADAAYVESKLQSVNPKWIAYDVETVGQMHNSDFRIECLGLEPDVGDTVYVWTREGMRDEGARNVLKRVIDAYPTSEQNGKYDDRSVELDLGVSLSKVRFDTRLARKLLEPEAPADLETIAELVGMGGHKAEAQNALAAVEKELRYQANPPTGLTPTGKARKVRPPAFAVDPAHLQAIKDYADGGGSADAEAYSMGYIDEDILYVYNARDVRSTREATLHFEEQLRSRPEARNTLYQITLPGSAAVRRMESWGVPVDKASLENVSAYFRGELDKLAKIFATYNLNPNSVPQLRELLFNRLKLKSKFQTDSGELSTGAEALEALKGAHPVVDAIVSHRKYAKLEGTYAGGLLKHIREDGRVHPSFLLDGTETGRLSSRDPNFQNFPRAKGNPEGKMVRDCIRAIPGWVLLEIDYSQLELRVAAYMSNDRAMIEDFKNGIDIHRNGARECCFIWGMDTAQWDALSKDDQDPFRSQIKAVIFGRLYGKTDSTLAKDFNTTIKHVEKINHAIWGRYKDLDKYTKKLQREAARTGVTWTIWDGVPARCRPLWKIAEEDDGVRQHAMNAAVNTPVQGTAADYMNASMWPIVEWFQDDCVPAELLAAIHDAGLFHVREDALREVALGAKAIMTSHNLGDVPLVVDMKVGKSWGSMNDYVP
jgi:uracil-DNA glycosylase family 4